MQDYFRKNTGFDSSKRTNWCNTDPANVPKEGCQSIDLETRILRPLERVVE